MTRISKGSACFNCRHCCNSRFSRTGTGWDHDCALGIDNAELNNMMTCPSVDPRVGFQLGGYYSHMWFENEYGDRNGCLNWHIESDGEFPTNEDAPDRVINFHVCDFRQIEAFVEFWGKELRRRGWVE